MRLARVAAATALVTCFGTVSAGSALAQDPTVVEREAVLAHPAGKLAIRVAELLAAGKIDEAIRLRTPADQEEWKKESPADRQELAKRMKDRAPDPKLLAEGIRKGGVLTVFDEGASLEAPYGSGGEIAAMFTLDKGKWFARVGPMVMAGAGPAANEVRIEGAEIRKHPVHDLALKYADAVHSGKAEAFLPLASSESRAKWKAEPESEKREITAYYAREIPKRAALEAGIGSGGVLIVEDDVRATLNVITVSSASREPGVVQTTSTTVAIPFVLEDGQWRVKR